MWKELKLKAFIKTYVYTGEKLPMDWSKYQTKAKGNLNVWEPQWGVIREPLDAATLQKIKNRKLLKLAENRNFSYWSEISPEAAFIFSKIRGDDDLGDILFLDGITHLTDESAELLGKATLLMLSLDGLETLSDSAAVSLSHHGNDGSSHCNDLRMRNLKNISEAAAHSLARHNQDRLALGLNKVTDEIGRALKECSVNELNLEYVTELSTEAANALGQRKVNNKDGSTQGILRLDSLKTISPSDAAGLARFSGSLVIGGENISDEALGEFANFSGEYLSLVSLKSLSEKSAKVLAQLPCGLHLQGLKSLPESMARILVEHPHQLSFGGLRELSEPTARILAGYKGDHLYVSSRWDQQQPSISDGAARELVKYQGRLSVGHDHLPKSVSSILEQHPTVVKRQSNW